MQSALFENNILLVAQHMMQFEVTGKEAAPMPERISAWAVYDVFTVKDGEHDFVPIQNGWFAPWRSAQST
jgi:crotonobetainyl-CoA:carnitine CoA-transferase CaiB-like acyl-CoA transferase